MNKLEILCDGIELRLCNEKSQMNSMIVRGVSQSGKSYFVSVLSADCILNGDDVIVIDIGDKWCLQDKQRLIEAGAKVKRVGDKGIIFTFATRTELVGCARYIANALGIQSGYAVAILQTALKQEFEIHREFSLDALIDRIELDKNLSSEDKKWVSAIIERIRDSGELQKIRFQMRDEASATGSVIYDLSGIEEVCVQIITYLLMYCSYCRHKRFFRKNETTKREFIVIDEFQNLDLSRNSIIGICLTEGAKYNLNLILITQFFSGNFSDGLVSQFKQAGFRFYFRLTEEDAQTVSRQLTRDVCEQKEIYQKLISLPQGHCLMIGSHFVGRNNTVRDSFRFVRIGEVEVVFNTNWPYQD